MSHDSIARTLAPRFADPPPVPPALADNQGLTQMHVSQTWSDGKLAQYERPQRTDFGVFIRGKGFGLG